MKTREQLEKECSRVIKVLLNEMEDLAEQPPIEAAEPIAFDERRRRVIRLVWQLFKDCLALSEPKNVSGAV